MFLYAPVWEGAVAINAFQTDLTLKLLERFLPEDQLHGIDIIISPEYKIIITQACNGMIPILFLFASILAYPSGILHKIVWMVVGYLAFAVANVARLLFVTYAVSFSGGRDNFYWAHDLLGNILLMIVGLSLFVGFIKTRKRI